jgi:hypothetical protein
MAKGLLRKALHGAAKSSSEILGAKIQDMRQKRLMDYEAGQRMAEAEQQNTWTTQRDERLAGQQATAAELAHQRAVQRDVFGAGTQANLDRESEEIAQTNRLALEGTRLAADKELQGVRSQADIALEDRRTANRLAEMKRENELRTEQARAEAASKGIDLKNIKIVQYDAQGEPIEIEMSGHVDPETLEVWFVDPDTNKLTTTRQQQAASQEQAFLANSAQFAQKVRDDDRTQTQIARTAAQWYQNSPDQLPLEDHLVAMGDKRSIFEQEIERLRTGEPTTAPQAEPEAPAAVSAPSNVNVVPSMLTRATQAVGSAMQADAERATQARQTVDASAADRQADYVLSFINRPTSTPGMITLPEVTMLNRFRLEKALESNKLTEAQKTALRAHLGR